MRGKLPRDPDERRDALLAAAEQALATHGPGASMRQMAAAAEVTKPILYQCFGGRTDLAVALRDRVEQRIIDAVHEAVRLPAVLGDTGGAIEQAFRCLLTSLERDRHLHQFVGRWSPPTAGPLGSWLSPDALANVLFPLRDGAGLDARQAEVCGYLIGRLGAAAAEWLLERRSMSPDDLARLLTTMVWDGLARSSVRHPVPGNRQAS